MSLFFTPQKAAPFGFSIGAPIGAKSAPFNAGAYKGNGNGAKVRHSPPPMARRSLASPFLTAPDAFGADAFLEAVRRHVKAPAFDMMASLQEARWIARKALANRIPQPPAPKPVQLDLEQEV